MPELVYYESVREGWVLLKTQYVKVKNDRSNFHEDWEIWSGSFNRCLRKLKKECMDTEHTPGNVTEVTGYNYLFSLWQLCNRYLEYYSVHRLRRKKRVKRELDKLKRDLVSGISLCI